LSVMSTSSDTDVQKCACIIFKFLLSMNKCFKSLCKQF
jgi:hypothetical protein